MVKRKNKELQADLQVDRRIMRQLVRMIEGSYEESGLDPETFMLVRIAALTAMNASSASWLLNLKVGKELEVPAEHAVGTLAAIAPIVGTARTVSAAGNIVKAMGLDGAMHEAEKKAKTSYAH